MTSAPGKPARLRVRELRERVECSQAELAKAAGIDVRTLRRIETDPAYRPSFEQVERIAAALGAPLQSALVGAEN